MEKTVCRFGFLPAFRRGETILYSKPWVWMASFRSLPGYRIHIPVPFLAEVGFYVTDRRLVMVAALFGRILTEYGLWFPGRAEKPDYEVLRSMSVGRSRILGHYLEVKSELAEKVWFRRHEMVCRFYMKDAAAVAEILSRELESRDPTSSPKP